MTPMSRHIAQVMTSGRRISTTSGQLWPVMGVALFLTPGAIISLTLLVLKNAGVASLLTSAALIEMAELGLLTLGIGMGVSFGIAFLAKKPPMLREAVALVMSQAGSSLLLVAALIHNPQSEFCIPSTNASAIASIYQLDSCSLTIDFWAQGCVSGLVLAIGFVLIVRIGQAFSNQIFYR